MAPRANWKGYLKLSLVSCAVALFPATTTRERVRFNIINRETGNRVRYDVVDAETGEEVPQEDRVKGYKVDGDSYVLLEEKELDEVALESTHTIEIESFVEREDGGRALSRQVLLPRARRQGGIRGLRGHPRGHARRGTGRDRARGALPPRAAADAVAARQGHRRDHVALQQRSARRAGLFRRHSGRQGLEGHARLGEAHSADQEGQVRSVEVRGSLRDRAQGTDRGQAGRQEAADARRAAADQCRQSDGCACAAACRPSAAVHRPSRAAARRRSAPASKPTALKRAPAKRKKLRRAS